MQRDWSPIEEQKARETYREQFGEQAAARLEWLLQMERWVLHASRRIEMSRRRQRRFCHASRISVHDLGGSRLPPTATLENRLYSLFAE